MLDRIKFNWKTFLTISLLTSLNNAQSYSITAWRSHRFPTTEQSSQPFPLSPKKRSIAAHSRWLRNYSFYSWNRTLVIRRSPWNTQYFKEHFSGHRSRQSVLFQHFLGIQILGYSWLRPSTTIYIYIKTPLFFSYQMHVFLLFYSVWSIFSYPLERL